MLLFLTTNMAAVTSRASQQYGSILQLQIREIPYPENIEDIQLFVTLETRRNWAEVTFAKTSGIVTGDAPVSYWPIFPVPSNSPRSLCEGCLCPVPSRL